MKIRKYLVGGILFSPASVNYNAGVISVLGLSLGTNSSSTNSFSISKSDEKGSIGILNKTMSDALVEHTLPNEAQYIINNTDLFGRTIDPSKPATSAAIYSDILLKMLMAKYNKEIYNNALNKARDRNALKGPAINTDGTVWVKTNEGLHKKYIELVTPLDNLLTVAELAQIRAYNPEFAFNADVINTIENATSIKEIQDFINEVVKDIGKEESKVSMYGNKTEFMKVLGLNAILKGESADGIYKVTIEHGSNTTEANHFLKYLYDILDPNQRAYLEVIANKRNIHVKDEQTGEEIDPVFILLREFVQGKYWTKSNYDVNFEKELTGILYGKRAIGETDPDSLEDIKENPALNFFRELGEKGMYLILLGNWSVNTIGTIGHLHDANGNPLGWTTMSLVAVSMFAPGMDVSLAHFGSARISDRDRIQVDGTKIVNMYLPIDLAAKRRSEIRPDFDLFRKATELQKRTAGMKDVKQINRIYEENGLPPIYSETSTGLKILTPEYSRFAVMEAYADRKVLPDKDVLGTPLEFDNTVLKVDDKALEETIISRFKSMDKNFKESRSGFIFTNPDLYLGMVFIPIYANPVNQPRGKSGTSIRNVNRLELAFDKAENNKSRYYDVNTRSSYNDPSTIKKSINIDATKFIY